MPHKGNAYPGEHAAIIDQPLWDGVPSNRDKHVSTLETLTPNDNHGVPTPRVKRIINPPALALIPGSMSLLRPEPARRISPSLSREAASAPALVAGSTMSSISSIG